MKLKTKPPLLEEPCHFYYLKNCIFAKYALFIYRILSQGVTNCHDALFPSILGVITHILLVQELTESLLCSIFLI